MGLFIRGPGIKSWSRPCPGSCTASNEAQRKTGRKEVLGGGGRKIPPAHYSGAPSAIRGPVLNEYKMANQHCNQDREQGGKKKQNSSFCNWLLKFLSNSSCFL